LLAKLKPNSTIPPHQDHGPHLEKCRRLHIPLITNDTVDFVVDDKSHNLKEGFVYEFDNTRTHHVTNNSDKERIHLIVDWVY
jgi:aspartyl/asparaginyl beta-hydroxylase (cupin superfamily)